jgi:hypothetical protein
MKPVPLDFSDDLAARALFDEAFQHPRRKYVVIPKDAQAARAWLRKNASVVNFVWCGGAKGLDQRLSEGGALQSGQLIDLETLSNMRNRCGWFISDDGVENDYLCDHPSQENEAELSAGGKRKCFSWNCPIAYPAFREDIRRKAPSLWRSDYKSNKDEPEDYMVLHSRPRYAYVPNVRVLGCEGWEQYA